LPEWIAKRANLAESLVSTTEDLRDKLQRLSFPTLASRLEELRNDLSNCEGNFEGLDLDPEEKLANSEDIIVKPFLTKKLNQTSTLIINVIH
jgi:hypothetical protein